MSKTGGKQSCEKLDLLVQALDQLVCRKETFKTKAYAKVNATYTTQLTQERNKLFLHETDDNRITMPAIGVEIKQPNLILHAAQMLRPTPTAAIHLQEKFIEKENTDAFMLELSAMHPFGQPTYGWMRKEHLMTAIRLIDSSKKHKPRAG